MESEQIELVISVDVWASGYCPSELLDDLDGDDAEDYLYDLLCSWLWRYMPKETAGFRVAASVTVG